ncbi:hypothetical protein CMK13_00785 [Candidatus Poribacteria bacterium]|nr:hypothetical protein [Candidatus Poribacteria bacterium]OUT67954.1 MAG: hypothetical protein CBB75_00575 [bacterium TMED15]
MKQKIFIFTLMFLSIIIAQADHHAGLSEDIVFLMLFDEMEDGKVMDSSGNDNNGTVFGEGKVDDGKFGKAFYFDGATHISVENSAPLGMLTNPMSVGAWVKPDALGGWINLVEMDGGAGWKLGFHGDKGLVWTTYFVKDFMATQPVEEEVWSHVAVTWDGSEATMFINGKEAEGSPISGGGVINVKDEPSLDIGYRRTSEDSYFKGFMDELFISNKVLSLDEITKYQAGFKVSATAVNPRAKLATTWANIKSY